MVTSALFRLNGEKYLSFQVGNLRFMDSFQFLSTSLDNLVVSLLLKSGRDKFSHATKHLVDSDLVLQRESIHIRIRPDATNSQKPNSHRSRPFIILSRTNLAFRKNYDRAHEVWAHYDTKTMQNCHDHYLLSGVLLLADVCQNFRYSVYEQNRLDPSTL